ncbi:unnamed protein product [Moneuplotes crassus]|uniref:BZIP domain-containing protein n=1 Tax=Euplotes crassus TaxID=5936 RepID=A0AAD1ULQ2_EUPCR|nr:unnamed protein product [Moneuplotes crassus]
METENSTGVKEKRTRKCREEDKETTRRRKNREKMKRYRVKLKAQQEDMEEENEILKVQVIQLNQQVETLTKENEELKAKLSSAKAENLSTSQSTSLGFRSNERSAFEKIDSIKECSNFYRATKEDSSFCNCTISREPTITLCEKIFKRENHFWQNTLPKLIQKNPEKVKYTLMEQNKDIADVYGAARIAFLKSQFRNIIQSVLPFNAIVTLLAFDEFKIEDWTKIQEKVIEPAPDHPESNTPPPPQQSQLSESIMKYFMLHGESLLHNLREIRSLMQTLMTIRNKLFRRLKELSDLYRKSEYKYDKNDHIAAKNKWDEYKAKGVDLFHIWKISKKQSDSEYISDAEMSEWEEEEASFKI